MRCCIVMVLHGGLMGRNQTLFRSVLNLVQEGNKFEARRLIADEINRNPGNADAWIVMAQLVDDRERATYYFERALELRPYDEKVQRQLERIKGPVSARSAQRHPTIGTPVPAVRAVPDIEPDDDTPDDDSLAMHSTLELIRAATEKPGTVVKAKADTGEILIADEDDTRETQAAKPRKPRSGARIWLLPALTILMGVVLVLIGASGAVSLNLAGAAPSVSGVPVTYRVTTAGGGESVITYLDEEGQMRQSRTTDSAWSRTLSFTPGKPVSISVQAPAGTGVNCEIVVNGAVVVSQQSAGGTPAACEGILATR
jgi:hypothetical protein